MFKKIKKRVDDYINRKLSKLSKEQKSRQKELFSYAQISQLFEQSHFIPMTSWSISPSTILHVLNDIDINNRQCIVEFGSGASTVYIAKYLKTIKSKARFFSIDSNQEWISKLKDQIAAFELQDYITIIYAPIEKVSADIAYPSQKTWYALDILEMELSGVSDIDVILVDGPYGGATPYARYSAVPFLKSKISDNCSVFLDDIDRAEEREILKVWQKMLDCNSRIFNRHALLTNSKAFITTPYSF